MKHKIINLLLLIGLSTTTTFAIDDDDISLHGYGTLGVAYQDNKNVLYRNSINSKKGTQGDLSFANYSTFGLQSDIQLNKKISVTAQGILTDNSDDPLELGWLNVKYQLNDNNSIRIGKMRLAAFMYSDILDVSYSYDWVRLPDMYSLIPLRSYTGIEFSHNVEFDNLSVMTTAAYGEAKSNLYYSTNEGSIQSSEAKANEIYAIYFKILHDDFTFRVGYSQFLFTLYNSELDSILTKLDSFDIPTISQAINQYKIENTSVEYFEIGARYDFEKSYLVGEYLNYYNESFLSNNTSWYIGTGYNFENWSPFILYSNIDSTQNYKGIKAKKNMPVEMTTAINTADQILSNVSENGVNVELDTISLGFRYNLSENSILKLQYDRQHERKKNRLNFHYSNDKEVNLDIFSATVSFVF